MATTKPAGELVSIKLADIEIREGANPRTDIDTAPLKELAKSIEARGVQTPILVRPNDKGAKLPFLLIAGERRLRAAGIAGEERVDAIVRSAKSDVSDLALALLENASREGLNPIDEAVAYSRLMEEEPATGRTRRGVAQFLGVAQKRVTERLQLLELPEEFHDQIARGAIPLSAISGLRMLNAVSSELVELVVRFLVDGTADRYRARSWSDFVGDPIGVARTAVLDAPGEAPAGVFLSQTSYPLSMFTLSDKTQTALAQLREHSGGRACARVAFEDRDLETARTLNAALEGEHGFGLIVGQDVADELVADVIARELKEVRALERAEKKAAAAAAGASGGDAGEAAADAERERQKQVARERKERAERRRKAVAYNHELGAAVLEAFGRVKLDLKVVRLLTAVAFGDLLGCLAMRGARYGYPGWTQVVTEGGESTTRYLSYGECVEKLRGQLATVKSPTDLAGRLLGLVVMARYANEGDVVDWHLQAGWELDFGEELGWSEELLDIVDDLAEDRLPTPLVEPKRADREQRRQERAQREELGKSIEERLDAGDLSMDDCEALREDIQRAFPDGLERTLLMTRVAAIEAELGNAQEREAVPAAA